MSRDRSPSTRQYDTPTERRGYLVPGQGYVPAQAPVEHGHGRVQSAAVSEESDYRHHPLHHHYRKRMRGVRVRWFGSGFTLGLLAGVLLTLIVSAVVVARIPSVIQGFTGQPDVAVVIGEGYLNREAESRIKGSYQTGVSGLTLTGLQIDLTPGNRMDLQPTFNVSAGLVNLNVNAKVKNQLSVKDGQLAINTVGDPQLGDLNLPLEVLPFDLKSEVDQAVDKVNNDLLISEINKSLQAGFGGSDFAVQGVTTDDSGLTIRLEHR